MSPAYLNHISNKIWQNSIGAMVGCQWISALKKAESAEVLPSADSWTHRFATTMTRGQPVSDAIQWTIIRLSATMPSHEISGYTDTSDRKIRDILTHFKKTGGIKPSKRETPTIHRSLQEEDIQV
jgi:hypothetical protein